LISYPTYLTFTFLGSHDSRLYFRPLKVSFFELSIKIYIGCIGHTTDKNFMPNKSRLWALMAFDWTLDPILSSAYNFTSNQAQKHENYSIFHMKEEAKNSYGSYTRPNLFLRSKMITALISSTENRFFFY
jgi:hypothetical protein